MILGDGSAEVIEKYRGGVAENVDDCDEKTGVFSAESDGENTHRYVVGRRNCQPQQEDGGDCNLSLNAFRDNIETPKE